MCIFTDDYTSVLECILNAVTHLLDSVYQKEDIFPYSLSNLTIGEVKRFLKKQMASFNFDSNNGMFEESLIMLLLLLLFEHRRDARSLQGSSSAVYLLQHS